MKSFGLLRTNVGLTTNVKIMVDSNHSLSLNSIDSSEKLSLERFKKFSFIKENYYDELVPYFFKEVPSDLAFEIKFSNDNETMSDDFSLQYDELYSYGARNIMNNKNYKEEFEYFAPLYINRKSIPKKFIIFRVDGTGLGLLRKENFKAEILDKLKIVKVFDLTQESNLGQWLDKNFTSNNYFPDTPLEMDFRNLEFCKWNGIDYSTGGYTTKSLFIDDILDEEKEIFELEKFVFENYKRNKVIFPNILNFSFLFDDEPSTPEFKRKWSINRYYGFYIEDIEFHSTISPYITPFLRNDVQVFNGNILYSNSSPDNPFVNEWSDKRPFYVEYKGMYYKVERYTETGSNVLTKNRATRSLNQLSNGLQSSARRNNLFDEDYTAETLIRYRIISDVDLTGMESQLNKNYGYIDSENNLKDYLNNDLTISSFDDYSVWIIEIDGVYHNLTKKEGKIKVNSDYSFSFNENDYTYRVAGSDKKVSTIVDFENEPKKFNIYKLRFCDIKDFDDRIIETDFARYEYEKKEDLTFSDEPKLYFENLNSTSNPPEIDDFIYKDDVVNIPVSSEYTANYETFKIENSDLSEIWRLNPVYCRWSFQKSLHTYDIPYMMNNTPLMEDFNRGPNLFDPDPKRVERNLDYFYTINSSTSSYEYHSLHVQKLTTSKNIDTTLRFDLTKYLNTGTYSYDYFSYFFDTYTEFAYGETKKNTKKFSEFNAGDKVIPNITLFKGIEFRIFNVESVTTNTSNEIENINLFSSNEFEDYKFSILLSDNDLTVNNSGKLVSSANSMNWTIIEEWEMDKQYPAGSIVVYDDMLYEATGDSLTIFPATMQAIPNNISRRVKTTPYNTINWTNYNPVGSIFWSPITSYNQGDLVFNNDEYYAYSNTGTHDFWNPITGMGIGYNIDDIVLYRGQWYISTTSSNSLPPDSIDFWVRTVGKAKYQVKYWTPTTTYDPRWIEIDLWNPSLAYRTNVKVVHNNTIWLSNLRVLPDEEPGISKKWTRVYSIEPDTTFVYQPTSTGNPIIRMNNKYYLINSNIRNSTLDNGLIIYINKKWKNILVNINIADNTYPNITNSERDNLYTDLYKKLTALNFINSINDITNKYGFTDYVSYVVIGEDGKISKYNYNLNITKLPYLLKCEVPDSLKVKVQSLTKTPIQLPEKIVPFRVLKNGTIRSLKEINYYNNLPVAATIVENKFRPKVLENLHGNKNITSEEIFRYTGYYSPLFYDIELFEKGREDRPTGNYKFDTSLTNFGMMMERKLRKCNRKGSILKLKDQDDLQSIYPMLDEFGYTISNFFIFKSTWDYEYHVQTLNIPLNINIKPQLVIPSVETLVLNRQIGKPTRDDQNLSQL